MTDLPAIRFAAAQAAADTRATAIDVALQAKGGVFDDAAAGLIAAADHHPTHPRLAPTDDGAARCTRASVLARGARVDGGPPSTKPPPLLPPPPPVPSSVVFCRAATARTPPSTLAVRRSRVAGLGLYTLTPLPAGASVVEYTGELVRARVADERERRCYRSTLPTGATFFFALPPIHPGTPPLIIDATRKAGVARFVNHACGDAANLAASIEPTPPVDAAPSCCDRRVLLRAVRDIAAGEELLFDYQLGGGEGGGVEDGGGVDDGGGVRCLCRGASCRGWL